MKSFLWAIFLGLGLGAIAIPRSTLAQLSSPREAPARPVDAEITCDILVVGGGLAGVAATEEGLRAGRTVCLTEITDWIGGQISAQGTSALDESQYQANLDYFPRGYRELRRRILERVGHGNPGDCWVSRICFFPRHGHEILMAMLQEAAREGKGTLKFFPNTVVKSLEIAPVGEGQQIRSVRAIQHVPAPGAPPLNTLPLSQTLGDSYQEQDSALFEKKIIRFLPPAAGPWFVLEATETGELLALADLPYRLGVDPLTHHNPSASSAESYPYCPQAFTYTFAMEATATPQTYTMPEFYPQYAQSYSYDLPRYAETPNLVFSYRRIYSAQPGADFRTVNVGDISMQNWGGGNDYGPGTPLDNSLYTREQLLATGQLAPGGWQGGMRISSLRGGEEKALGYFYWLYAGTNDAKLGPTAKQPIANRRYLQGLDSPMGTVHGLSKHPYIREGRRLIGRYAYGYPQGFGIPETAVSRQNFRDPFYRGTLTAETYRNLIVSLSGLKTLDVILGLIPLDQVELRQRSRIYSDSVGIGHYPIDFHPCMALHPPERPGNFERPGERQGAGETYPYQIPLRAMIPPQLDNLLVTGKNIATSHISAASYRVHPFEWSAGAAAGTTLALALEQGILPFQLVENLPRRSPSLEALQRRLNAQGNPTAFPGTSIFNQSPVQ